MILQTKFLSNGYWLQANLVPQFRYSIFQLGMTSGPLAYWAMSSCLIFFKENLSPQSGNLGRVMQFIADVCADLNWVVLLKILSGTMEELVQFPQLNTNPSVCHVNIADLEIK